MPTPSKNIRAERIKGTLDASEFDILGNLIISGDTQISGGLTATTISATTYQNLPSSDLVIGTTQINSGIDGRILFQSGTTLQQDGSLFWDNTNSRLSIGQGSSPGARLDVRAQGALSTDIAFRVRNSADTRNIVRVTGDGNTIFTNQSLGIDYFKITQGGGNASNCIFEFVGGRGIYNYAGGQVQNGIKLIHNSTTRNVGLYIDSGFFFDGGQNLRIGQGYSNTNQPDASATRTIQQMTGVAPTTSVADGFQQYSADITAGNAAPHFRTENGSIVKLYQNANTVAIDDVLVNTGLRVSGGTSNFTNDVIINSLTATTISAATYQNLPSSDLVVGTTQINSGTDGRILFQSGTTLQQDGSLFWDNTNKSLGIGTSSPQAKLDVRAQGNLSTDVAFRVRNSADTANLLSQQGDGMLLVGSGTLDANDVYFRIKQGSTNYFRMTSDGGVAIGNGSTLITGSATPGGIAIGLNASSTTSGGNSWGIAIGRETISYASTSIAIGGYAKAGQFGSSAIAIGSSAYASGSGAIVIGSSSSSGNLSNNVVLIGDNVNIGATNYNRIYSIGSFISNGSSALNNIITLGGGTGTGVNLATSTIADSFNIFLGATERSFFVNKNSNVVLRSLQTLVAGTNYDTSATNTITISTGTTPSTNIIDSSQIYVTDRGGTAGRASLHVRSEDGTINVLGDRTGINTSTPQARLHVENADTTLTTGLFSGTGQNILTVVGSGNTTSSPLFTVQGSSGELFSVSDSLVGSLFSVNDISGLPILEVFSDNTTLMGSYLAPSLNTTARVIATTGTTDVYSIPTSAYTGAFFDYTVSDGTNLRAGNIMSIWSGSSVNITETQTTDFGNTSGLTFNMVVSSGNAILRTSGTTGSWTIKTIVRGL